MKRRLSLLLAVVMILGSFSFAFAAEETAEEKAGAFLMKVGVLEGINGELKLEDNLRRQDAVVLVARLHGAEDEAKKFPTDDLKFTDFKDPFYRPIIAWAVANDLVEGHTPERFGFNEDVTAQQYATILLRALGYNDDVAGKDGYAKALELAKKLGVLENVEVENDTAITRGQMAVMTFNALGQKMKDSDKTLAEFLGIDMPVEKPEKLEAKVYTENLKEIVVELNDASLVDAEKLTDVNKYRVINNTVERVKLDGDKVLVELKNSMTEGRTYELIVRDLHKDIDKKYRVTAKDNVAPEVLEVTSLGEYGIRVTTSEPVRNARERNFLIDGRNVSMRVEEYGRELVLIPYHNTSFPENAQELTIKALEDFAGFKSSEQKFDIKLEKDENGPKVEDVIVKGQDVIVKFDKDIFSKSVKEYESRRQPGNISYEEGRHTITAKVAKKIDIDTIKYNFEGQLPRRADRVDFTIVGVENHSRVEMEKAVVNGRVVMDYSEPIILDSGVHGPSIKYSTDGKIANANVKIYFDKDIVGNFKEKSETEFVVKDHLRLYEGEVLGRNDKSEKIVSVKYDGSRKDVLVVELKDLVVNTRANNYEFNYILEVENFRDTTSTANRMYRDYVDFEISQAGTAFGIARDKDGKLLPVDVANYIDSRGRELTIYFNKPVDKDIAENPTNYFFIYDDGSKDDLADLGGRAIAERDGLTVSLQIPFFNEKDVVLEILPTLKDVAGVKISGARFYDFNKQAWEDKDVKPTPVVSAITYIDADGKEIKKDEITINLEDKGNLKVKSTKAAQTIVKDSKGDVTLTSVSADTPTAITGISGRGTFTVTTKVKGESEERVLTVKVVESKANVSLSSDLDVTDGTAFEHNKVTYLAYGTNLNTVTFPKNEKEAASDTDFNIDIDLDADSKNATFTARLENGILFVDAVAENGELTPYKFILEVQKIVKADSTLTANKGDKNITVVLKDQQKTPQVIKGIKAGDFKVVVTSDAGTKVKAVAASTFDADAGTYVFDLKVDDATEAAYTIATGDVVKVTVGGVTFTVTVS